MIPVSYTHLALDISLTDRFVAVRSRIAISSLVLVRRCLKVIPYCLFMSREVCFVLSWSRPASFSNVILVADQSIYESRIATLCSCGDFAGSGVWIRGDSEAKRTVSIKSCKI